ncbi:MAG TPA: DUF2868 domain-containing protein [Pseudomonadales bacterium]|nr:DUF2868 domain-containing protein [Pseudomonadales bacterium]
MLLDAEDAFALVLIREAEAEELVGPVRPRHGVAEGTPAGVSELVADARTRIEARAELAGLWRARAWLLGRLPGPWLLPVALVLGVLLTGLAADGSLNILTPPLIGLVLWQWLAFAALGARRLLRPGAGPGAVRRALQGIANRIPIRGDGRRAAFAGRVVRVWSTRAAPLLGARLAATLHGAGACFALGAIAGLYFDGLGVEYRASWESTFLDAGAVHAAVQFLFGPAAFVSGLGLPDRAAIAAMRATPVGAAPWIHLWALTLVIHAVTPRLLLAALAGAAARRPLALDDADPWLQGSLAALAGTAIELRVQPLGYRPTNAAMEQLQARVGETFGARALLERNAPLPWDAEARAIDTGEAHNLLLMVNAAQTPEDDVHGPLLDALAARVAVTVVLDAGAYAASAARRTSRLGTWRRMLDARGTAHLTLEAP